MKKRYLALLLLASFAKAKTIKEIKFDGLLHLSPTIAKEMVGLHPGEQLDMQKIDEAIKKFYAQGYFKDIWVEEENGKVIFHFVEKPLIAAIEVLGYLENKKEELDDILGLKKGDIYDDAAIEKAKEHIKQKARSQGFFDTVVEVDTEKVGEHSVKVTFIVNKGEKITIEDLTLCGAKTFDKDDIEDVVANRERNKYLGWMIGFNSGELKLDQLELDAARIKNLYLTKGYLDAQVSDPFLRVDFDNYKAKLRYHVQEGKKYSVASVDIKLLEPIIKKEQLLEDLRLAHGKVFNIEKMRKDIETIKRKIADLGYAFVRIAPDFQKDEKNHTVKIRYIINPGEKVYIKDVIISGNQRTLDRVIRREVYLAPGDVYNYTDLIESKNALRRTGFFSDVKIEERRVGPNEMNLLVRVKEMPTGNIMVGGGYSSYEGFLINASINDKNIFGSGIDGNFQIDYSSKSLRFNLGITNPRVFDSDYSLGLNLYNTKFEYYDYTQERKGGSLSVGKRFTRHLSGSLTYAYEKNKLSDVQFDNIYFQEGTYTKSAFIPRVVFDNTDDYYLPRSGMNISGSIEYAGVGGDEKYTKFFLHGGYYYGLEELIDYDLILRAKGRVGYIVDNGNLPVFEKFYLGGIRTLRGYETASLSPKDSQGRLIGGKEMFSASLEASIPMIKNSNMRLTFFVDYGGIGEDSFSEITRAGAGAAIEWFSPMGPIQLVFVHALNDKEGDRVSNFEFSVGTRF
ncbi:outer membrane protein insertion porin family [Nitratiruptor sp. YY08-26]|uniref:outer membrane protein assembly factor BamA n=1 Tax=unclassified Nitratiruptor TaxID=2624044 RepID=UPI0019150EA9|nr:MULTISPECIES: outer membrane protein assembly factor BamA [unclassified Nitratiruptor]BCD61594.1 outer membrane protein insertion porin family [Nitratiruptor sp. YY08-13]BCD65528.1 outer membrane protein insertion porin family [Nitratiruptor sp. YY08-26]